EYVFRRRCRLGGGERLGREPEIDERERRCIELESHLRPRAASDNRHLAGHRARAGADLQLIESDDIALHAHLRADRSLLAVDLALNRNRIRPALTHELVQWAEVSFERNGGVDDLAAEATADG